MWKIDKNKTYKEETIKQTKTRQIGVFFDV